MDSSVEDEQMVSMQRSGTTGEPQREQQFGDPCMLWSVCCGQ